MSRDNRTTDGGTKASKIDVGDVIAETGDAALRAIEDRIENSCGYEWVTLREDLRKYNSPPPTVIEGLLRRGDVMTIVAPPKSGKSWLTYHLAFAVATGGYFLQHQWQCQQGRVAIIDNETHRGSLNSRLATLGRNLGIDESCFDNIYLKHMRNRNCPLIPSEDDGPDQFVMEKIIENLVKISPAILIIDALYRFAPSTFSENDNSAMTRLYCRLGEIGDYLACPVVVVHHTPKGIHGQKEVTDVGAGAGAQSRASDLYMVLRPHEDAGYYVLEAKVKDFKNPDPLVIRYEYPRWRLDSEKDPSLLKGSVKSKILHGLSADEEEVVREARKRKADMEIQDMQVTMDDICPKMDIGRSYDKSAIAMIIQSIRGSSQSVAKAALTTICDSNRLERIQAGESITMQLSGGRSVEVSRRGKVLIFVRMS